MVYYQAGRRRDDIALLDVLKKKKKPFSPPNLCISHSNSYICNPHTPEKLIFIVNMTQIKILDTIYYNVYRCMSAKWMYHVFPEEYATSLISCCFYGYIMGATGIFFVILDENHGISGYTQVWWLVTSIILYLPIRYFWKRYIVKSKTCDRIIKNADEYKGLCNALFSLFFCIFGIYAPVIILGIDQFLSK